MVTREKLETSINEALKNYIGLETYSYEFKEFQEDAIFHIRKSLKELFCDYKTSKVQCLFDKAFLINLTLKEVNESLKIDINFIVSEIKEKVIEDGKNIKYQTIVGFKVNLEIVSR